MLRMPSQPFPEKSCASMLIIRLVAVRAVDADPSRFVALRRPWCPFVDQSFFLLFQASRAPALPPTGGSFERETGDPDDLSGARKGSGSPRRLTSCVLVVLRVSSWITLFFCCFRQAAPPPPRRADHSREKQGTRMAYRQHGKVPVPLGVSLRVSWSSLVCLRG